MGVGDRRLLGTESLGHTRPARERCVCRAGRAGCDFPSDAAQIPLATQGGDRCGRIEARHRNPASARRAVSPMRFAEAWAVCGAVAGAGTRRLLICGE